MVLLQELPEQVYLHPPLSIFVVEKRAFGHTVLVGTHVVSNVMKFSPRELEEEPEDVSKGEMIGRFLRRQQAGSTSGRDPWRFSSLLARQQKSSPETRKMPRKSTAWGRLGLGAGCDPSLLHSAPDWYLGSSSSQVMERWVRAVIPLWGWQRAI